jgi:hypothetical protein
MEFFYLGILGKFLGEPESLGKPEIFWKKKLFRISYLIFENILKIRKSIKIFEISLEYFRKPEKFEIRDNFRKISGYSKLSGSGFL